MKPETNEILELIQESMLQFISKTAIVLEVESSPLNLGYQAVNLSRHKVLIDNEGTKEYVSFITKMANKTERRILHRLFLQSANVPFSRTHDLNSENRALIYVFRMWIIRLIIKALSWRCFKKGNYMLWLIFIKLITD